MDRSQYLAAALQGLQTQPQIAPPQVDVQALAAMGKNAKAYQQVDPGGSYIGHNVMQAGRNVTAVPQNAISGLQRLAQSMPGMTPPSIMPPSQPQANEYSLPPEVQAQIQAAAQANSPPDGVPPGQPFAVGAPLAPGLGGQRPGLGALRARLGAVSAA